MCAPHLVEDHSQARSKLNEARKEIATIQRTLKPVSFMPHLVQAIDNASLRSSPPRTGGNWRTVARRVAGTAGFGASIA
jgi:hypothetical protein